MRWYRAPSSSTSLTPKAHGCWQIAMPRTRPSGGPAGLGVHAAEFGADGVDAQGHVYVYWVGTDRNLWEVIWDGSAWQGQFNRGYGQVG